MSRTTRRLGIGFAAALLTTGLATAPATAQELPENSSGISAPNGWTPEGSVPAWAALSGTVVDTAIYRPELLPGTAVMPSAVALSGTAPLVPWCGPFVTLDSPQEGCD
ncbi:MAG TPA: hypothetical protein H9870_07050 [Candidatus Corynebacterium avicola]|uniref:Uncharacterized protein n=1 Tax=Candidatus Corynebacterium avicola TaxID=2838527 RepID=A0A9D1RQ07_9CORY|nr:hypothetical protein [Candidatus Corynebacterium avicola]